MALPVILGALRAASGLAGAGGASAIGSAGRGIGAALSGSGTAAEKFAVIGKNVEKGLSGAITSMNAFSATTFNVQIAAQGLNAIAKAVGSIPAAPIKAFSEAIHLLQAPLLIVVDSLKGFVGAVGALGSAVSEFVKLSNPIYVLKFNLAMEDLTASIGKILTPVLIASTAFVRAFADVIFKMSGPLEKLMAAFFDPLTDILPELVNMAAPFIEVFNEFVTVTAQVLAPILKALMPVLVNVALGFAAFMAALSAPILLTILGLLAAAFVSLAVVMLPLLPIILAMAAVGYALKKAFEYVAKALGLDMKAAGGSVGAAVRPATIGSVEDYGRKAQQAAFSLGTAADPATKSADYLEKIWTAITGFFERFPQFADDLAMAILKNLPGSEVAGGGIKAAKEAGRRLEDAGSTLGGGARILGGLVGAILP